ncbi:MAG: DUF58 domain-containing protein [Chloroflexi bacterium]|nr:DUF58 domain-containing protein [Chloroflexota bacterium]
MSAIDPDLIRRVARIELRTRKMVDSSLIGAYRAAFRGRGVTFDSVRPYEPGDDVRHMDWKVSARIGEPHVKQFAAERDLSVMLVIDDSGSMRAGAPRSKREVAAELAAAVAWIGGRAGDRVGALTVHSGGTTFVPARRGRNHVLRVIRAVLGQDASLLGTDLTTALRMTVRAQRQRGIIFVLSDFLASAGDYQSALALAAAKHDVVACVVSEPLERAWPDAGLVVLEDAEDSAADRGRFRGLGVACAVCPACAAVR